MKIIFYILAFMFIEEAIMWLRAWYIDYITPRLTLDDDLNERRIDI